MSQAKKFFSTLYNWISFIGSLLSGFSFAVIVLLVLLEGFSQSGSPYIGIITYIIMPVFLVTGLVLIPLGMLREYRRRARGLEAERLPALDLNIPRHRRSAIFFIVATGILFLFTSFGIYRTFEFTESVAFCGQVCHDVMEPEFVAYQNSPHARVKCVDCHVGSGAEWFVRSKLSGAHQVLAVLTDDYARPIATPIRNLRPARETCEQCHWPAQFYGKKQTDRVHYLPDDDNTRWHYNMLMKIGGSDHDIHWHINNKVEYIAEDEQKTRIPWVRVTHADGHAEVFTADGEEIELDAELSKNIRTMDCMDCHNRPSHIFRQPKLAVNSWIETGRISNQLPGIKTAAVEAIEAAEEDPSHEAGLMTLAASMRDAFDGLQAERQHDLETAIRSTSEIYQQNFFPKMKASWRAYPNHIGHLSSPGCYRCHDGNHTSEAGNTITDDCNACHLIIEQDNGQGLKQQNLNGLVFKHPEDIEGEWKTTGCYECHAE